ncbi:universal stress protein [uncultured Arenimonas sp.]|uniref:universal stress protein n=1 Tax=uncultured Arenimonas sp. TaxID=546226 RepID=UPI0030DD4DBF
MSWSFGPIWAGTDFSQDASLAVQRAARLSREHGAPLHLLHALDEGDWLARAAKLTHGHFTHELLLRAAGSQLARLRDQLLADGVPAVETHVSPDSLHKALHAIVADGECGMFVMGARGEGNFREGLLGSTADRVLRSGSVPVLLCRRDASPCQRVVLATDFSPASEQAARLGLAISPEASHYLLHASELVLDRGLAFANTSPEAREAYHREAWEKAGRQLTAFTQALGAAGEGITRAPRQGRPAEVLSSFVDETAADLVVLGARPRARWENNLLGSTAHFAVNKLACDVLVVPGKP